MRVGIIGYGRFGQTFAALLRDHGLAFRAYDPQAEVPPPLSAPSLRELASDCSMMVLAIPIPSTRAVLEQVRPMSSASVFAFVQGLEEPAEHFRRRDPSVEGETRSSAAARGALPGSPAQRRRDSLISVAARAL